MREISAQSSYCGQNDLRAHFGLGDAAIINSIAVEWLSGAVETYNTVNGNDFITIIEGQGILKVGSIEKEGNIKIYPNPTKDFLNIEAKNHIEIAAVNIYNVLGQLAMTISDAPEVSAVDVSGLASGNYFIKIDSQEGTFQSKFIKN